MSGGNYLNFNLCSLPLVLSLGSNEKTLPSSSLCPPSRSSVWTLVISPWASFSPGTQLSQPLLIWKLLYPFHSLCLICYNVCAFRALQSPELLQKCLIWRITTLSLLVMLLLMRSRLPLAFFAMKVQCQLAVNSSVRTTKLLSNQQTINQANHAFKPSSWGSCPLLQSVKVPLGGGENARKYYFTATKFAVGVNTLLSEQERR